MPPDIIMFGWRERVHMEDCAEKFNYRHRPAELLADLRNLVRQHLGAHPSPTTRQTTPFTCWACYLTVGTMVIYAMNVRHLRLLAIDKRKMADNEIIFGGRDDPRVAICVAQHFVAKRHAPHLIRPQSSWHAHEIGTE
eukprot:SAG11_NODE_12232_length_714_cov_1.373984_1_plen_138_part_00